MLPLELSSVLMKSDRTIYKVASGLFNNWGLMLAAQDLAFVCYND